MPDEKQSRTHNFIMENRKKLTLTGVQDVESFDENTVLLETDLGELTIKGTDLHILGFNKETGDLDMEGMIYAFVYSDTQKQTGSVWSRIFK